MVRAARRPLVMAGLDPAIYRGTEPGYDPRHGAATDGRVKPGHDEGAAGGADTSNIRQAGIILDSDSPPLWEGESI
jgi:hypothetical protein